MDEGPGVAEDLACHRLTPNALVFQPQARVLLPSVLKKQRQRGVILRCAPPEVDGRPFPVPDTPTDLKAEGRVSGVRTHKKFSHGLRLCGKGVQLLPAS